MPRLGDRQPLEQRLWSRVVKHESGCWLWMGKLTEWGYAKFWFEGRTIHAHRLVYELVIGPIPAGRFVCHRCDVRHCLNPDHFFLGTAAENSHDMVVKGRSARGERVSTAKLTSGDVALICQLLEQGVSQVEIAKRFGVSTHPIYCIRHRKNWRHVLPSEGVRRVTLTLTSP